MNGFPMTVEPSPRLLPAAARERPEDTSLRFVSEGLHLNSSFEKECVVQIRILKEIAEAFRVVFQRAV